ncbi:glycerophosphodiester phosphodiesterase family protein [Microbacterium sp. YY-01]|uniref:glycerophosphodiester phosphodiesterase family protein n=1 Tax=Microbacterium sp. YY-01 TaxID=3421634 RepID=UPI003D170B2B
MTTRQKHPFLPTDTAPVILAHRGLVDAEGAASGVWENSALAFAAAHASGVEYIETDCRMTADGDVVLFHDETLQRLAGIPTAISDMRTRELSAIFADHGGLLTLAEALYSFPTSKFNVDVKEGPAADAAGAAVAAHATRVLLTSFDETTRLRAMASASLNGAATPPATSPGKSGIMQLLLALSVRSQRRMNTLLRSYDALQIPVRHAGIKVLRPRLLAAAHAANVDVHVWTIDDEQQMQQLVNLGVDGLVTNRADNAVRLFPQS